MENLFVENEQIVYIEIIGDPVYDIYNEDNVSFINNQLSRDAFVDQSQIMMVIEDVHEVSHFNLIKEEMSVRSMEIVELLSPYHKEHMKTKFQFFVMCFAPMNLKIKLMVQKNYIILFDGYYRWKAKEKDKHLCHGQRFGFEDHG